MLLHVVVEPLLKQALQEDLGQGDPLGLALEQLQHQGLLHNQPHTLVLRPRQACVASGLQLGQWLCQLMGPALRFTPLVHNGQTVEAYSPMAQLEGPLTTLLQVERTLLNLLQHSCGVATHTRRFVQRVEGTGCNVVHTRKTLPLLRLIEQQAVLDGGGAPHRYNLGSSVMVKDNLLQSVGLPLPALLQAIRAKSPHTAKVEVEADTLEQVAQCVAAGADVILLDNMTLDEITQAIALIDGRAVVEVSGGITLENIRAYAELGVAVISTSQLTLAAPPVDLGLDTLSELSPLGTPLKAAAAHAL